MKFPKITANTIRNQTNTSIIEQMDVDLLEDVEHYLDIDPENDKTFKLVIRSLKTLCRTSMEYKSLMWFLKEHREFNATAIFRGVKRTKDIKYSIEVHHTPFVMEDIIVTVLNKRIAKGESLKLLHIAEEIMEIHYEGLIGLVGLDKTSHAAIHSDQCPDYWFPIQFVPFGSPDLFVDRYMRYIPERALDAYSYVQDLSLKYDNLLDIIPKYMETKKLYYDGFVRVDAFEELLQSIKPDK